MNFEPVSRPDRILLLDFVRGFALFGILMVNMMLFSNPHTILLGNFSIWNDPASKGAVWFIRFFFEGKFYVLFSLLFGMGFQLFLQKMDEDKRVVSLFRRRILFLLFFGVLHIVLLWFGDILVWYALFGFVMTWFRKKSNRQLLIASILFFLIPIVLISAGVFLLECARRVPTVEKEIQASLLKDERAMQDLTKQAYATYSTGSFAQIVRFRLTEYKEMSIDVLFFCPNIIAIFLIGVILMRKRCLVHPEEHIGFFKSLFFFSFPIGVAGSYIMARFSDAMNITDISWLSVLLLASNTIGGFFMALSYLSAIALLFQKGLFHRFQNLIASAGRMALTNYILQSILATTLFYSYGFGLYGKISPLEGIWIAVAIYAAQLPVSYYWLRKYRYGPMEWLWRSLTYGKRMGMSAQTSAN